MVNKEFDKEGRCGIVVLRPQVFDIVETGPGCCVGFGSRRRAGQGFDGNVMRAYKRRARGSGCRHGLFACDEGRSLVPGLAKPESDQWIFGWPCKIANGKR